MSRSESAVIHLPESALPRTQTGIDIHTMVVICQTASTANVMNEVAIYEIIRRFRENAIVAICLTTLIHIADMVDIVSKNNMICTGGEINTLR